MSPIFEFYKFIIFEFYKHQIFILKIDQKCFEHLNHLRHFPYLPKFHDFLLTLKRQTRAFVYLSADIRYILYIPN